MKFACSLEMVNMLTSGPGAFTKQSKKFWMDYLKYIAAVGFRGIELPFNCFHSDAMAFEMGRSGIPCNADAIRTKYDSADGFLSFLKEIGIDEVTSVHINANDAMLELIAVEAEKETYYPKKMNRDQGAREAFRSERSKKRAADAIYLIDILREEWQNDDARLSRNLSE